MESEILLDGRGESINRQVAIHVRSDTRHKSSDDIIEYKIHDLQEDHSRNQDSVCHFVWNASDAFIENLGDQKRWQSGKQTM